MKTKPVPTVDLKGSYNMLALGVVGTLVWLPWLKWAAAAHLAGAVALAVGVLRLAPAHKRLDNALPKAIVLAVLFLIDLAFPSWFGLSRRGFALALPATLIFSDFILLWLLWDVAAVVIAEAETARNVSLKLSMASRRDLLAFYVVIEAILVGPLLLLWSDNQIASGFFRLLWWGQIALRLATLVAWATLLAGLKDGYAGQKDLLDDDLGDL